jgi:hypothetical protein
MKHKYLLAALLAGALTQPAQAQTTVWRPFRPKIVYQFWQSPSLTLYTPVFTLRVDSAYATAIGDSVYTFNRVLRPVSTSVTYSLKSRNNLFGARLRWRPGSSDYYLEANAEAILGPAQPMSLLLRPRAAVGSTWSASTQPALTATLSSRAVYNTTDSLATISLSNGQQFLFSRSFGLQQGPQLFPVAGVNGTYQWQQFGAPQVGLGIYDPRNLFKMQVGDELGYSVVLPYLWGSLTCKSGYRLCRITSRVETADSLLIGYKEQEQLTTSAMPGCGGQAGTVLGPIKTKRWAFSLRTGASPQFPFLGLLTNEYLPNPTMSSTGALVTGGAYSYYYALQACWDDSELLDYRNYYPSASNPTQYNSGIDALAINQSFLSKIGMGPTYTQDNYITRLVYYRVGTRVCGSPGSFTALLPSRAAEAATAATLHPNPAAEAATLTLAEPTRLGTVLTLTDALGRHVWSHEVAPSQTSLPIALAGQPAGLYLVQLVAPSATPLTWKLQH